MIIWSLFPSHCSGWWWIRRRRIHSPRWIHPLWTNSQTCVFSYWHGTPKIGMALMTSWLFIINFDSFPLFWVVYLDDRGHSKVTLWFIFLTNVGSLVILCGACCILPQAQVFKSIEIVHFFKNISIVFFSLLSCKKRQCLGFLK